MQRIQTVFLFLGALCIGLAFPGGGIREGASWIAAATAALFGVSVVGAIAAIFLHGNRQRQRTVVIVLQYIMIAGIVSLFAGHYLADALPFQASETRGSGDVLSYALPIAGYALFYLARRGIDRDINLIRSMDRLR